MSTARTSSKFVIIGCGGVVGEHTIRQLADRVGGNRILVLSHDPSGCCSQFRDLGADVQKGDLARPEEWKELLRGCAGFFIITPEENRAELVLNGIRAAREAHVPHLLVVSAATADKRDTIFGRQFSEIEDATKSSGLSWTILRLPLFMDNLLMQADSIKREGKFYGPAKATAKHTCVAVADVGAAAVAILTNPEPHKDKVYLINGPSADFNEDASAFPRTIGREVRYEQISYDEAQKFYVRKGMPEWQAKGLMELYRLVDEGQFNFPVRDFKHVTGHHPTNFEHWLASVKDQFE